MEVTLVGVDRADPERLERERVRDRDLEREVDGACLLLLFLVDNDGFLLLLEDDAPAIPLFLLLLLIFGPFLTECALLDRVLDL